ncbi:ribosomal large subunit pseudouridine synthase D [Sulfurimonas gotlandica GD1]|uniref:Pseudouridine synthase n=1 Tax=Sulfurimonas gotlandica (strain DSM 19862 / JCM 16533 / GD1) TaxID=929558 RepID=B6BNM7_SULGG|nr:RluA family pseudouridine synthase [Sulfurimonas gotlandica]EDZ61185.1 ribosomal large subunit pseudouridine synthase, RluA family [Sulfurimonas gotlandica GD1]EHP28831.1 ribosomal large subunit pseudouridine synthase D [Sulfurimonas gotlandica GD1]
MSDIKSYVCDNPERLDIFLASEIGQTRSQIASLIKHKCVFVDEKLVTRPGVKLKSGQNIKVEFPEAKESPALDIDFNVEILYEDDDVLVINKPSGVTVHPAPSVKEATLVDWLKHKGIRLSNISGEERHGIVHRLDKGTSGTMVVAKNNEAHEFLSEQLQDKSMGRYYLAVLNPPLKDEITTIEQNIGRSAHNRLKMTCTDAGKSKYAKTMFKVLSLSNDEKQQFVACKLFTGRTHQIRVHLESINRHIIGDHIYALSPKAEKSERILLHAYMIYFVHPTSKEKLTFVAPLDETMKDYLDKKFDTEQINEVMDTSNILRSFSTDS